MFWGRGGKEKGFSGSEKEWGGGLCFLTPILSLKSLQGATSFCANTWTSSDLSSPIRKVGAQHEVRKLTFLYLTETSGCLPSTTEYSNGHLVPQYCRMAAWLGLLCEFGIFQQQEEKVIGKNVGKLINRPVPFCLNNQLKKSMFLLKAPYEQQYSLPQSINIMFKKFLKNITWNPSAFHGHFLTTPDGYKK